MSINRSMLLSDTLNLLQMAQATADSQDSQDLVERLSPVVSKLRELVEKERESSIEKSVMVSLGNDPLLANEKITDNNLPDDSGAGVDRNLLIQSMSLRGMSDLDIARHFGVTREEVRIIINMTKLDSTGRYL